jgi:hypothetical protein
MLAIDANESMSRSPQARNRCLEGVRQRRCYARYSKAGIAENEVQRCVHTKVGDES